MNRTRLPAMSARRLASYVDNHGHRPMSTFTRRRPQLRTRPYADTGPDDATVKVVLGRDVYRCVRCGTDLLGPRGVRWSIQHRRARGMGGTTRPDTNRPQNLIALCGSATTGCHGWVEDHPTAAEAAGWRVRQSDDPALIRVQHHQFGLVFLAANGGTRFRTPSTPRSSE
jgi:hypothetical protein